MPNPTDVLGPMPVATLTRWLNSTELGVVVGPHQIYRHRNLAGGCFDVGRRVDLVRYTAWLWTLRAAGTPLVGRRPRARQTVDHDGSIHKRSILALVERQAYRCALSGRMLTPKNAALDHILPVSRGGAHRIGNAQVLHKVVNRAKGTLTNEEFIALCGEVWRHAQAQRSGQPEAQPVSRHQPSLFSSEN